MPSSAEARAGPSPRRGKRMPKRMGAVEAATLAAFVAYALETNKRKNEYLDIHEYGTPLIDERYNDYRAAYRTRNILGYLTLGVYLANYYDALYAPVRKNTNR